MAIREKTKPFEEIESNVLVTENSQLVQVFLIPSKNHIITIDSDFMMKSWNLSDGSVEQTILIKKEKNRKVETGLAVPGFNCDEPKLEYASLSKTEPFTVVIADDEGNITIHNLYSGTILFHITHKGNKQEVNMLKFLDSNIYLCSTTPAGNVIFYTKPLPSNVLNPNMKGGGNSEHYVSQTLIKKNVH